MRERWAESPRGTRWLAMGIASIVAILAVGWVLFVPAADWLAHQDVGPAKGTLLQSARDAARGRLLTFGAGALAAGALLFTARTFTLSREGQVTDRYTKAIEQLGSDKVDVRIGGIYALERIARDSAKDHPTVMAVLTAFVREHSQEHREEYKKREQQRPEEPSGREGEQKRFTRPDIQAALTVIGRRDPSRDQQPIDLQGAFLDSANLSGARLAGANLVIADLVGANLEGANLADAGLAVADLSHAVLDNADLARADLQDAKLIYAGRRVVDAWLSDMNFTDANLMDADLSRAHLRRANFTNVNLLRADFSGADLRDANFTRAFLGGACFAKANLAAADLSHVRTLDSAKFTGAYLDAALWPDDTQLPVGWKRDADTGQLHPADTGMQEPNN
jgi:uncharacterized protein YjbI with pentapeptide repeats